jgi:hypothetical protein
VEIVVNEILDDSREQAGLGLEIMSGEPAAIAGGLGDVGECTGRNQPSRISCASPRASLRSVFTGIADSAAFTCRVSRSSTGSLLSRNAPYSHCDSGLLPARSAPPSHRAI